MSSIQVNRYHNEHWELLWNGTLQGFLTPVDMDPLTLNALQAVAVIADTQEQFDQLLNHWLSRNVTARFTPATTPPWQG